MKMKKILFILCFFIMIFIPFNNVYAYSSENYDPGSNGDGLDTSSYSDYCNTTNGCVHNERGIRVTLVNNRGVQISGTHFVDFWDKVPINARAKSGTKYRSYYVNNWGNGLYGDGTTERGTYTSVVDTTNDLSLVGGSISYSNQHELIEGVIRKELAAYKISKNCSEFKFFEKFGYSNFCNDIKANDCDEKLSKIYVLIEPVYYVNYNKKNVVLTATELIAKIYKTRIIQGDTQKTYNLNKAAFDNAMTNMFLTSEDDKYEFYKSGKAKKKYNTFDQYAGDLQDINISEYYNSSTEHQEILKASIGLSSKYTPLGNSMHLVWLGVFSKDYCNTPKCCIPCDEGEKICKEKYGENFYSEDPECCYADMITNEKGVCVSKNKYWKGKEKPSYCKPTDQDNPPSTCNPSSITPEFILGVCTEDDSETISYFRDGVFSSSGQISANDENTYEYISTHANTEQCIRSGYMVCLPPEWVKKAVSEDGDNTFLAVASSNDSTYITPIIPNVCTMYCQEIFEVVLPDNYPYVNAGKYFKWTIKDSENTLASSRGAMLCATEINLDYIVDEYKSINDAAKSAASELANTTCDGKYGIAPVKNAEFVSAEEYLATYEEKCAPEPCRSGHTEPVYDPDGNFVCNALVCDSRWTKKEMTYGMTTRTIYIEGCGGGTSSVKTEDLKTKEKIENYKDAVENWNGKVEPLVQSLKTCGNFSKNYEIDMQTELSYQTLFDKYSYSTPDQINKINAGRFSGDNDMCADNDETADCNKENHIFALSDRNGSEPLTCHSGTWTDNSYSNDDKGGGPGRPSTVLLPVETVSDRDELYQPDNLKVKIITGIYDYDRNSGEFLGSDVREDVIGQWETIKMQVIGEEAFYELNKKINACICKDGYVTDSKNDECVCEREVSYYDFTSQYSNYQKLDDGTLTVEFMNGSGLYPISLKYWTLGSVSYHEGHFDSIATNMEYSKNVPPKICSEEGDKTVCTYGDPDGVCRYVIKNRIIAHPDDKTDCDDGPCVPCEDEPCGPEPTVTCIDDDGSINEECRDLAGLNVIYRVVDLNDPFPEGRSPGTNWIGKEGVITDNRDVSGMQLYSSSEVEPLYSFELTPAVIKEIRRDTANLDPAKKYTVGTVVYQNGETTGGYSLFIHHTLSKYGTINLEDDKDNRFEAIIKTGSTIDWGE